MTERCYFNPKQEGFTKPDQLMVLPKPNHDFEKFEIDSMSQCVNSSSAIILFFILKV